MPHIPPTNSLISENGFIEQHCFLVIRQMVISCSVRNFAVLLLQSSADREPSLSAPSIHFVRSLDAAYEISDLY